MILIRYNKMLKSTFNLDGHASLKGHEKVG
jgi:hypothetical protein